ncbi:MAG: AAA family ATPase, partial [Thiothrix sp.]|nr:AAA family ATPase [Thiothrix sp.]
VLNDPKKPKSINQALGGYGAGHNAVSDMHRMVREAAGWLMAEKGMNIVFIAHALAETVDPPDTDSYTRYSIRMNTRSVAHYSDNVDLVGFIKLRTFTRGDGDVKKATTTGERIITCHPTASHISKNRFGIKEDLIFAEGSNPFVPFIPALQPTTETRKASKQGA